MKKYIKSFLSMTKKRKIEYNQTLVPYFTGTYNAAFANERTIELGIIFYEINKLRFGNFLEIGNVTQHYKHIDNLDIVDKYEKGNNVINCDILDYHTNKKYDLIFAISTFEHIGFDEKDQDPTKFCAAIEHCKSLLASNGKLIITIPAGYNLNVDKTILCDNINHEYFNAYRRITDDNSWKKCSLEQALNNKYNTPFNNANGLVVLEFKKD